MPHPTISHGAITKSWRLQFVRAVAVLVMVFMSKRKFDLTSQSLRDNILQFHAEPSATGEMKKNQTRWQGVLTALSQLKSVAPPIPIEVGTPAQ